MQQQQYHVVQMPTGCHFKEPPIAAHPHKVVTHQLRPPGCHAPMHQPCTDAMHRCHARPSLPVNQNTILTPPNLQASELHDTAAQLYENLQTRNDINKVQNFKFIGNIYYLAFYKQKLLPRYRMCSEYSWKNRRRRRNLRHR